MDISTETYPSEGSPRTGAERRDTFESEMLPYMDALYRTAFSMTRNGGDAEDLVQDTYLRAFQFLDQFQTGTNARAWLFRILTNLFINSYRRRTREPERVSYDEMEDFYLYNRLAADSGSQTGGRTSSPEEVVVQSIEVEAIRDAIDELPDQYRTTVVLADLNEFSYEEISDILQIPIGTVRSRLSRGRRLVQKSLWAYTEQNAR